MHLSPPLPFFHILVRRATYPLPPPPSLQIQLPHRIMSEHDSDSREMIDSDDLPVDYPWETIPYSIYSDGKTPMGFHGVQQGGKRGVFWNQ